VGEDAIRDDGRDARLTVAAAAERLGITKEAVRKRISRGTLRSDKDTDGTVRVYIPASGTASGTASEAIGRDELVELLRAQLEDLRADRDAWRDQARRSDYMASAAMDRTRELESRIRELEAPSEARESPETVEEESQRAEPRPDAPGGQEPVPQPSSAGRGPESEAPRGVAASGSHSRLGMSARALAVGAIATSLSWFLFMRVLFPAPAGRAPFHPGPAGVLFLVLPVLVPLMAGLWAGSTKRPSLPWFSSPHRWLRRGGRSALEYALFATGIPAMVGFNIGPVLLLGPVGSYQYFFGGQDSEGALLLYLIALGVIAGFTSLAFMSGAFVGNALRRVGFLGTPKELPQGEEVGHGEEEAWSAKKEAQWGLAGSIIVALISALASIVAAALSQ
jgi:hypothetical protein